MCFKKFVPNTETWNYLILAAKPSFLFTFSFATPSHFSISLYLCIFSAIFFIPILTLSFVSLSSLHSLCVLSLCFHLLILFKLSRRGFSWRRVARVGGRKHRAEWSWQANSNWGPGERRVGSARLGSALQCPCLNLDSAVERRRSREGC